MWEYRTQWFAGFEMPGHKLVNYLNEEGKERWELVHVLVKMMTDNPSEVATYEFIFKRRVE